MQFDYETTQSKAPNGYAVVTHLCKAASYEPRIAIFRDLG